MRTSLVISLSLAALRLSGGELLAEAPADPPLRWEIGGSYALAHDDLFRGGVSKDVDCSGIDLTAVYRLDEHHSLNLRFGLAQGDECLRGSRHETWYFVQLKPIPMPPITIFPQPPITIGPIRPVRPWPPVIKPDFPPSDWEGKTEDVDIAWRERMDIRHVLLMPGYRYTHQLTDALSAYAGVNVGLANTRVKVHYDDGAEGQQSRHDSDFGFAYSAELGLRYQLNERCELFAAYEFMGMNSAPRFNPGPEFEPALPHGERARKQRYSALRAGVSLSF